MYGWLGKEQKIAGEQVLEIYGQSTAKMKRLTSRFCTGFHVIA